jgi:hypothetical protein
MNSKLFIVTSSSKLLNVTLTNIPVNVRRMRNILRMFLVF